MAYEPSSSINSSKLNSNQINLIKFLNSPNGTIENLKNLLSSNVDVNQCDPDNGHTALHTVLRVCPFPLQLSSFIETLLKHGADVNATDCWGVNPLMLLAFHINRGLRYHYFEDPAMINMIELGATKEKISEYVVQLDEDYQTEVFLCLDLFLSYGAHVNSTLNNVPEIIHNIDWLEAFEHKLMQQERRWKLLHHQATIEQSTYNIFNPISQRRVANESKINLVQIFAWRGQIECLQKLCKKACPPHRYNLSTNENNNFDSFRFLNACSRSCPIIQCAKDGRSALHFLYHYCHKLSDLVPCTKFLLSAGVDPNAYDIHGNTCIMTLLNHIHVKRSYIKYLGNSYTNENIVSNKTDCFDEIIQCVRILISFGANLNHHNFTDMSPLHIIFHRFQESIRNCDTDFQTSGHYLVPYSFSVVPLTVFTQLLVELGAEINATNYTMSTILFQLISSLMNWNLTLESKSSDASGNSTSIDQLYRCFETLFSLGAHLQDHEVVESKMVESKWWNQNGEINRHATFHTLTPHGESSAEKLLHVILTHIYLRRYPEVAIQRIVPIIELMVNHGANINSHHPSRMLNCENMTLFHHIMHHHIIVTDEPIPYSRRLRNFYIMLLIKMMEIGMVPHAYDCSHSCLSYAIYSLLVFTEEDESDLVKHFYTYLPRAHLIMNYMSKYSQFALMENFDCVVEKYGKTSKVIHVKNLIQNIASSVENLQFSCKKLLWKYLSPGYSIKCHKLVLPLQLTHYVADLTLI